MQIYLIQAPIFAKNKKMQVLLLGNEPSCYEIMQLSSRVTWKIAPTFQEFLLDRTCDVYINLSEDGSLQNYPADKTIFINSVQYSLQEKSHPTNIVRFNGWSGFINRKCWEVAGSISQQHLDFFKEIDLKYILHKDEPGFATPRIIAMIVNEGYFAKSDNISTESEIDTAMKLGTNYPKGPFEWAKQIGLKNIYHLLSTLSKTDERYTPCQLIQNELNEKWH